MAFIDRQDYIDLGIIAENTLNELTRFDDNLITNMAEVAESFAVDHLNARYDVDTELTKTGSARHRGILYNMCCVGAYYMHKKISTNQVPENVLDGYVEAKNWFEGINKGTLNPTGIAEYEDGERDYIKYGGETRRENRI